MLLVKVHQPGIDIKRIKQVNGNSEFCQEFFDDVPVPAASVVGEINGGWSVASRQMFHERNAVGGGSPYVSGGMGRMRRGPGVGALIDMVRDTGRSDDPRVRELVAEAHAISRVQQQLIGRITAGMQAEQLPPPATAITRLFSGESASRLAEIGVEVMGPDAVAGEHADLGTAFVMRQAGSLGGGTTEISRNIISERVLGMPREPAADRDVPFNQVRQGR
jgi:alkylation response protein AidB-like acyl-CoA dehydrogenase